VESAFVGSSIKTIFSESAKYFSDMFAVKLFVVRVNENVVKVDDCTNVEHVGEDIVHKSLESGWRIG